MPSLQLKITKHVKKQESMAHSQKKLINLLQGTQTLDLLDKAFKSIVLNMLTELKEIMDKVLKETKRMLYEQIKSINKETEITKKGTEIWEPKSTITKMKNSLEGFSSRSEQAEKERVNFKIGQLKLFGLRNREKKE